jgi:hypothetical protein
MWKGWVIYICKASALTQGKGCGLSWWAWGFLYFQISFTWAISSAFLRLWGLPYS